MATMPMGTPNYVNPPSDGWKVETADLVTVIAALVFVLTRLYTRLAINRAHGWEDYCAVIALLLSIARTVLDYINFQSFGAGLLFKDIRPSQYDGYLALTATSSLIYILVIMFAKLSLLLCLYRIFSVDTKFRYVSWIVGTIMTLWSIIAFLLVIFSCRPVGATFSFKLMMDPKTVCKPKDYNVVNDYGFCNIVTDFALLIMPMPMLWKLKMPRAKKIGIAVIFATGSLVCAISIVRQYIQFTGNNNVDPARSLLPREIWLSIESNVAIICGCLPVLTPLFRKLSVLSRFLPSTIRSKITGPSAMEQASWPSVLRGPRRDVEQGPGEKVVRTPWRAAPWREPDSSSEESASPCVQETYHHHDMPSQPELGQIHRVGVAF